MLPIPPRWRLALPGLLLILAACGEEDPGPIAPPVEPAAAPELAPLPEFTAGTAVTLAWSPPVPEKGDAPRYLAQTSIDAGFGSVLAETDWTEATEATFEGLDHGVPHHFRVRARDGAGALTDWSTVWTSTPDAVGPAVAIAIPDTFRTSLLFELELSASDDLSGLDDLELWYRVDGGELLDHGPVETGLLSFQAEGGGRHEFFLAAGDVAGNRVAPEGLPLAVYEAPEPIIIVDRHGEEFDITNAVLRHGIHLNRWEHGIGRNTIRPEIDPRMIGPGHFAYPSDDNLEEVCGVSFDGDSRAYKIGDLSGKEVANDTAGGVPIAVCY